MVTIIQAVADMQIVLIILFSVLAVLIWIAWSSIFGAPWIPTPNKRVRTMLEIADVGQGDIVYDLGSGDGRIIIMAAKEFGAQAVGIEMDPIRIFWSKLKIRRQGLKHTARVISGNFFKVSLEEASVVTIYQAYGVNKRIREKLDVDLRPGTRVVSYRFILDGWTPVKTDEEASTYLYVV
ncbi:MAG: SAM-dependent methyltransferase [Candidatus Thorarchaeota archaeon]